MPKTFNTWAMVSLLHIWILKTRLRRFPTKMASHWNELITNLFFWEVEKTLDFEHQLDGTQRKANLDHYFKAWTGMIIALDEGLIKGDAKLAAALWRNLFDAKSEVDPIVLAMLTLYVRREVARVAQFDDDILVRGYVGFGVPVTRDEVLQGDGGV